jgi:hypothetical protein
MCNRRPVVHGQHRRRDGSCGCRCRAPSSRPASSAPDPGGGSLSVESLPPIIALRLGSAWDVLPRPPSAAGVRTDSARHGTSARLPTKTDAAGIGASRGVLCFATPDMDLDALGGERRIRSRRAVKMKRQMRSATNISRPRPIRPQLAVSRRQTSCRRGVFDHNGWKRAFRPRHMVRTRAGT